MLTLRGLLDSTVRGKLYMCWPRPSFVFSTTQLAMVPKDTQQTLSFNEYSARNAPINHGMTILTVEQI